MTNGEKHIEKLLSWYKEAVTEDGVCYLTCDDKNTLAYALKCCKHYEDIKKDIDSWMLREELSSSEKTNKSEIPTGLTTKNDLGVDCIDRQATITFVCKNTEEILKDTMPLEVKLSDDYLYENIAKIMRNPKVLPSVTPQEPRIITCKDCKYYRNKGNKRYYCTKRLNVDSVTDRYREPNFYCADAVLREVEE